MAGPWEKYQQAPEAPSALGFTNRAIAGLGYPIDAVSWALGGLGLDSEEPFGGTKSLRRGMEAIGADVAPEGAVAETYPQRIGEGVGQAASMLIPGGAAVGLGTKAAGPVVSGVSKAMAKPFVAGPGRAIAVETAAGAGAGAGGLAAERKAVESGANPQLSRFAGELAGGLGAAVAPGMALRMVARGLSKTSLIGSAMKVGRAAMVPFTESGAMVRASNRVRGLSGDPEADAARITGETEGGLTPAQETGNPRLMALERSILDGDAKLDKQFSERSADSTQALRDAIREPAGESVAGDARQYMEQRRGYLRTLLDQRVLQAGEKANQAIAKLEPQMRETEASSIVRRELDGALRTARSQEGELWSAVPQDVQVPTNGAREALGTFKSQLGRAQYDDIPADALKFLEPGGNQSFGAVESVKEVHGLYSKMREVGRQARAAGDSNKARIANGIADAILKDLETAPNVGDAMETARAFSRDLNSTFRQGRIGRLLGYAAEGGASTPPEATLGATIGRTGTAGAVSADELKRAVGDRPDAVAAMSDYMRRRFTEYTSPRGEFNPDRGKDFLRQNSELLDRFPELKTEIQRATEAGSLAGDMRSVVDQGVAAAEKSPGAAFVKSPVEKEFATILQSQDPRASAKALAREAASDPSGNATRGLKAAALDHLIAKATKGEGLSGKSIRDAMADKRTQGALAEILSPEEMRRLGRIAGELEKVNAAAGRLPDVGKPMADKVNSVIGFLGTTLGARQGAKLGSGTSGAALKTASEGSKRVQQLLYSLTNDKAEQLLKDAISDPELFRALLTGVDTPQRAALVERRLVEWLGAETGQAVGAASGQETAPAPEAEGPWSRYKGSSQAPKPPSPQDIQTSGDHVNVSEMGQEAKTRFVDLQRKFGSRLTVTSGYRDPEYNAQVGGARKSQHMHGDALDIDTSGMSLQDKQRLIRTASAAGFNGIGIYDNSIHVDTAGKRAWGPSYKSDSVPDWARALVRYHMDGRFTAPTEKAG